MRSEFNESDDVYAFEISACWNGNRENPPEDVTNLCEGFDGTLICGGMCNAVYSSLIGKGFDSKIAPVSQSSSWLYQAFFKWKAYNARSIQNSINWSSKKKEARIYTFGIPMQIGDGCGTSNGWTLRYWYYTIIIEEV